MYNKIHYLSLVLIGLMFFMVIGEVFADASAELEQAKANIISIIKEGNYAEAQSRTQKLLTDFSSKPALPETLYNIAETFRWYGATDRDKDKYGRAQKVYQQIIANYPDSPFASKAALGIAKTKVLYFIVAQDYNSAGQALDEMVATFANDPNLPDELYWIGRGYGYWERHEAEKNVYQRIIQNYPDSPYADRSRIGFAKANVQLLIMSKDYEGAKKAFDKLTADFKNHPDLPESIYWIAERYNWMDRYEDAKVLHQKIIEEYPDSSVVDRARLDFSKSEVLSLMVSKEYEKAEEALDMMFTDFKGHPDFPRAVLAIGEQCYKQGLLRQGEDPEQTKNLRERAVKVWERLINELPDYALVPEACCCAGDCYLKLGKYQESIRCFQKVVDNYPDYKHAWHAQFTIGRCYEELGNTGIIEKDVADAQIKAAYEQLLEKYPNCPEAESAYNWLTNNARIEKEN